MRKVRGYSGWYSGVAVLGEYKGRKELLKYLKTLTKQPKMYADHTMN